jgi:hypothetical protein
LALDLALAKTKPRCTKRKPDLSFVHGRSPTIEQLAVGVRAFINPLLEGTPHLARPPAWSRQ